MRSSDQENRPSVHSPKPTLKVWQRSICLGAHRRRVVFAAVAFSLLLQSFPLFTQEAQPRGPQVALSSILALGATDSTKALGIVRQSDAAATPVLSRMLMAEAQRSYKL